MAILRGKYVLSKEEKVCGYPNCDTITKSGGERNMHWKNVHDCNKCPQFNLCEEILEIFGIDVVTRTKVGDNIGYIKCPLFKCPLTGCEFAAHKAGKLLDHIRYKHKKS